MKEYFKSFKDSEIESLHRIVSCYNQDAHDVRVFDLLGGAFGVFHCRSHTEWLMISSIAIQNW